MHESESPDCTGDAVPLAIPVATQFGDTSIQTQNVLIPLAQAVEESQPSHSTAPPEVVPGYEIECEIGRGAMGVVYKAKRVGLNRTVALKMILGGAVDNRTAIRFLAEAEAVAAIDHPNVVRMFDYGNVDGRPFMALEYVTGGTLKDALTSAGRVPPADAAALVEKIARGVNAAHELGIVHRDLKPANILLGKPEGGRGKAEEDAADSAFALLSSALIPKVSDFGLAKRAAGAELTRTCDLLGTPGYMSPEQASGRTKFVGPATDVWALGVILFECLTGCRPFDGASMEELLAKIIAADAPSIRSRDTGIARDLEMICQKCLAKEPSQRYATAGELAADLRRFQAGEPIAARPPTLWRVVRTWAGQNFGSAGWAVPGGIAIGVAVGVFTLLDLVGVKFYKWAGVYDHLPSESRPLFAFGAVDRGFLNFAEVAMYLLIPGLALLTTVLVRPRSRSADVAAGLVTGLVGAFAFFAIALGWSSVYVKAVHPGADDLKALAGSEEELTTHYPDLTTVPPEERRKILADKIYYDAAVRIPVGVLLGIFLSFGVTVPTCTALMCIAGGLLRRHQRLWTVVPLYLEVTLPTLIFTGYFFLIANRWVLMRVPPQHPECYAGLLALTATAVWAAATKRSASLRIVAQVAWLAFYSITNYRVAYEF